MFGSGPPIGSPPDTSRTRRKLVASRLIRAAGKNPTATTPAIRRCEFRARSSRAVLISALRIIAAGIDQRRAMHSPSIPAPAMSGFGASIGRRSGDDETLSHPNWTFSQAGRRHLIFFRTDARARHDRDRYVGTVSPSRARE